MKNIEEFIGKEILFHCEYDGVEYVDDFIGTHVSETDEEISEGVDLLWNNDYRYVTLEYAIKNLKI